MRNKILTTAFWLLVYVVAAGLSWLVPPMQSPDENSHVFRAYMLSQGNWLLQQDVATSKQGSSPQGGLIDVALLDFARVYLEIARQTEHRLTQDEKVYAAGLRWSGSSRFVDMPGAGYYFPAVYLPQATGLAIAQALNWSVLQSYQLARALTLLTCLALLAAAARVWQPNPLVAAVLLLPMSVFQLVSPTIDGVTTALAVMTISLFLRGLNTVQKHSVMLSWSVGTGIFVLASSRLHLLPLLVLPFFLVWRKSYRQDIYVGTVLLLGTLAWLYFALNGSQDNRVVRPQTTGELLALYAGDPLAFFSVLNASLIDPELSVFYLQSFIGILGWLDTRLPDIAYPALWIGLGVAALASVSLTELRQDWTARVLLLVVAVASSVLIFLALLVAWTPYPASVVAGVQGRYFVVPAICLGYALSGYGPPAGRLKIWSGWVVSGLFALLSLGFLAVTLVARYR